MAVVTLHSLADTRRLGRLLAAGLRELGPVALLLRGPLGSGKTTLTAALTAALPGGDLAEVGSPSFTICNYYPTTPPVLHADLYRSPGSGRKVRAGRPSGRPARRRRGGPAAVRLRRGGG